MLNRIKRGIKRLAKSVNDTACNIVDKIKVDLSNPQNRKIVGVVGMFAGVGLFLSGYIDNTKGGEINACN